MIVETETAVYFLTLGLLVRMPREEALRLEEYNDLPPAAVAALRKDGQGIPYELLSPIEVGRPAKFRLQIRDDGIGTIRVTTNVVKVIE